MAATTIRRIAMAALAPVRGSPYSDADSLESGFRRKRFDVLRPLLEDAMAGAGRADVLDLGGTETYWKIAGGFPAENRHRLRITLLNTESVPVTDGEVFSSLRGSATDPDLFAGRTFDLVHSNSVIEHVGVPPNSRPSPPTSAGSRRATSSRPRISGSLTSPISGPSDSSSCPGTPGRSC